MRIVVIIPVYGLQHLTHALIEDIHTELVDIVVVDNMGNYEAKYDERIYTLGSNLGWLKGCNYGMGRELASYDLYVLLNNDTRLSKGFFAGLRDCIDQTDCKLLTACYDDVYDHLKPVDSHPGKAEFYIGAPKDRVVPFIDGTCMAIPSSTLDAVGVLDEANFAQYGYGADFDYSLRVRAKFGDQSIYVTERSYFNHFHQQTAKTIMPSDQHVHLASEEMNQSMHIKWGADWRDKLWQLPE